MEQKSLRQIAREIGVSHAYLSNVRNGKKPPSAKVLPYIELFSKKKKHPQSPTWEEHLDAIKAMDKLVSYHQQFPSEIIINIDTDKPIAICNTSDWQLGQHGVPYDKFGDDVQTWIDTDGLFLNIGGDGYQNIIQLSKMGSSHNQTPISVQKGFYYLTIKKLAEANRILCIGTGNHNYWTAMAEGEDWDGELAKRLNLVYTKHATLMHIKVGQQIYSLLRMHQGRYNSVFNLTHSNKQNQRMHYPDARIIVIEHHHQGSVEQYLYNGLECAAVRPGTYAVYDDHALQYGYFGSSICNPTVVLYPNEDRLVAFKDQREAIIYLKAVRGESLDYAPKMV